MARRSAPPGSGPAYYSGAPSRRAIGDPNESAFSQFLREEIWAPEKMPGNISILTGIAVFFGGIAAIRTIAGVPRPAPPEKQPAAFVVGTRLQLQEFVDLVLAQEHFYNIEIRIFCFFRG
ncbi:hypothetical protein BKA93DRAFT_824799 [Sparassis latifolia]